MPANMRVALVAEQISARGRKGLVNAAGDVLTASTPRTPYRKGELRQKRRVVQTSDGAAIQWSARHAGVQNAGRRRGAKPFTKYTTAGTGKDFVKFGLDQILPKILGYFK